jgi:hypothetical protein
LLRPEDGAIGTQKQQNRKKKNKIKRRKCKLPLSSLNPNAQFASDGDGMIARGVWGEGELVG